MDAFDHQSYRDAKICRICANSTNYLHSIDAIYENISYATIIQVICPVKIEQNDELPKFVCFECEGIVLRAYKLRDFCLENDRMFRARTSHLRQQMMIKQTDPPKTPIKTEPNLMILHVENIPVASPANVTMELLQQVSTPVAENPRKGRPPSRAIQEEQESMNRVLSSVDAKTSKRRLSMNEPPVKKIKKDITLEDFFSQAGDYIAAKEANEESNENENDNRENGDNETKSDEPFKHKCDEENCDFSHIDSNLVKLHGYFDHSDILEQPSSHAVFEVNIGQQADLVMRPFGNLRNKDGSRMTCETPVDVLFCKLCMSIGKILHINVNEGKFLQHILKAHLDINDNKEEPKEKVKSETSDDEDVPEFSFKLTRKGHRVVVKGNHRFYAKKLPPNSELPKIQSYRCSLKIDENKVSYMSYYSCY